MNGCRAHVSSDPIANLVSRPQQAQTDVVPEVPAERQVPRGAVERPSHCQLRGLQISHGRAELRVVGSLRHLVQHVADLVGHVLSERFNQDEHGRRRAGVHDGVEWLGDTPALDVAGFRPPGQSHEHDDRRHLHEFFHQARRDEVSNERTEKVLAVGQGVRARHPSEHEGVHRQELHHDERFGRHDTTNHDPWLPLAATAIEQHIDAEADADAHDVDELIRVGRAEQEGDQSCETKNRENEAALTQAMESCQPRKKLPQPGRRVLVVGSRIRGPGWRRRERLSRPQKPRGNLRYEVRCRFRRRSSSGVVSLRFLPNRASRHLTQRLER